MEQWIKDFETTWFLNSYFIFSGWCSFKGWTEVSSVGANHLCWTPWEWQHGNASFINHSVEIMETFHFASPIAGILLIFLRVHVVGSEGGKADQVCNVGAKSYGKIHLTPIHFDFRFWKCLNVELCLPNSSVSKLGKYWIYTGIIFLFTIVILFLLSFLGILSYWSNILQKEGYCAKEKNVSKIINKNSN